MQSPIFSSFYYDRAKSGSEDVCINLYPEHVEGPKGPEIGLLINLPGYGAPLSTIGAGPIRGAYVAKNGLMYVVSGNQMYSVNAAWVSTLLGTISSYVGPVSMIDSPTQVLVVDGVGGWCWNFSTSNFTQVIPNTTSNTGPNVAIYQDGFGIVNSLASNQIYQSAYDDLSVYTTLGSANNAYIQGNPRDVVTMFDLKREVWVFKSNAIEIWINEGNPGFAFAKLEGVYPPVGCSAPASVARVGESLFWLGSDEQGTGIVYASLGYQAKPITTPSLAAEFQSYSVSSDAIAYGQQIDGHYFYVITFPTANKTYAYDIVTGKWHRRGYFSNGSFGRERANCHVLFNGKHVIGDYQNGQIYALSDSTYTDNGEVRKWVRSWAALPPGTPQNIPFTFNSLQIMLQTGVAIPDGTNPQIMLRWSDDGGYTWTGYFQIPAGKTGQTSWRAIQNRLGTTKIGTGLNRIWEISGTDPIPIKISGAEWEGGPA